MAKSSLYVEQSVLGGLIMDNAHFNAVSALINAESFSKGHHRLIYRAIERLATKHAPFDLVTLSEALKSRQELDAIGGIPYLAMLVEDTPTADNTVKYAEMLKEYADNRRVIETLELSLELLKENKVSTSDIIEQLKPFTVKTSTHNAVLDNSNHYCKVDFLDHVSDKHTLKQYAVTLSKATGLPIHTVFLVGLGVFSSIACRRWCVEYRYGGTLPIGLYIVAEHPSGTSKSRIVRAFQEPFYLSEETIKKQTREQLQKLIEKGEEDEEIARLNKVLKSVLFVTNATSEALEKSLFNTDGYFSAVSAEQGLFNTILGSCYSDKVANNDLLLNGFCAEFMGSLRVSREGYTGIVVGGVTMFAQSGGIETLLKTSNGTGLAERFLMIAEKHNLGKRDHKTFVSINRNIADQYAEFCRWFVDSVIEHHLHYAELSRLDICSEGWNLINDYRNHIEHHLADGGKYSHIAIRGAAAKVDMQIMKIAANLHLLADYHNTSNTIDLNHIKAAITIADSMLETMLNLCRDKSIIGEKAEYEAILSLFETSMKPRTEREIIQSKSQTNPFKDFTGNKSDLIRATLADMVTNGILQIVQIKNDKVNGRPIKAYTLAQ